MVPTDQVQYWNKYLPIQISDLVGEPILVLSSQISPNTARTNQRRGERAGQTVLERFLPILE